MTYPIGSLRDMIINVFSYGTSDSLILKQFYSIHSNDNKTEAAAEI